MDECDPGTSPSGAGSLVDESGALLSQVLESDVNRRNRVGDVVQALALALEESADRGVGAKGSQQLNEGASHWDHRLLDALSFHHLAIERLYPVARPVAVECQLQIMDRDGDVVEIDQLHEQEAKRRTLGSGLR